MESLSIIFTNTRGPATPKTVTVSQVVTEPKLLERSSLLEGALAKKQYSEFCEHKIQSSETEEDKNLWSFLKVTMATYSQHVMNDVHRSHLNKTVDNTT